MADNPAHLRTIELVNRMFAIAAELERLHPGRRFTPDGHMVGSLGEVLAAAEFGLALTPASTKAHDAVARDGRKVEIKLTGGKTVALRHEPEHLLVLVRGVTGKVDVVYNGPGAPVWGACREMAPNGQRTVSVARLRKLDAVVEDRLRLARELI